MRTLLCLSQLAVFSGIVCAQSPGLTLPYSGNNQKATVVQYIGPVRVSIDYSSPAVHGTNGQDRRGQIWGKLVPYGLTDLGFGNRKPGPWRAGANENTVFAVSHPVTIEGQSLPAGRYGLHMIVNPEEWTIIFSKNSTAWGSFWYEDSEDALRVNVKPKKHDYREYLTYEFLDRKPASATAEMQWEDMSVAWNIKVPDENKIYITQLKKELQSVPGFTFQGYVSAAQFCVQNNTDLEQGLKWADTAIQTIGTPTMVTLSVKAQILSKLGRGDEAKTLMQTAMKLPTTTPGEIHQYGRALLNQKKSQEALEVFKYNFERNGDAWPIHVGLARGYMAVGDNAKALEHAKKAAEQAPDDLNKKNLQAMVEALSQGKPFNN
jgi:tetratricopeptide (TPR) repeat protein